MSEQERIRTLQNKVRKKGKYWAVSAMVDGSIGYYSPESSNNIIKDLMNGKVYGGSERCMSLYGSDGIAEIESDFKNFERKESYNAKATKDLEKHIKILLTNKRERSWAEQASGGLLYPTSGRP